MSKGVEHRKSNPDPSKQPAMAAELMAAKQKILLSETFAAVPRKPASKSITRAGRHEVVTPQRDSVRLAARSSMLEDTMQLALPNSALPMNGQRLDAQGSAFFPSGSTSLSFARPGALMRQGGPANGSRSASKRMLNTSESRRIRADAAADGSERELAHRLVISREAWGSQSHAVPFQELFEWHMKVCAAAGLGHAKCSLQAVSIERGVSHHVPTQALDLQLYCSCATIGRRHWPVCAPYILHAVNRGSTALALEPEARV